MLKELEEKAILNPIEKEHVEPKAVKIDLDDYDNDIFVQDIIPEEDYIELYKECIYEIYPSLTKKWVDSSLDLLKVEY